MRNSLVVLVCIGVLVGLPLPVEAVDCSRSAGGNVTISSSCSFPASVDGADAGTGTSNTAVITVGSGTTLTVSAGQTVAAGSLDMTSTGTVAIVATGQIKPGSPLWMYDADSDGYPKESTMAAQSTQPPGHRRRNLMTSMTQRDCQDFYNSDYNCQPVTGDLSSGTHGGTFEESSGTPALSYRELAKDNATVGLWHMNEASGTSVADSSGNSNTGTATGTTVVAGKLGNGRSFNGTSDYIESADSSNWDIVASTSTSATISLWVKHNDNTGSEFYLAHEGGAGSWALYQSDNADGSGTGTIFQIQVGGGPTEFKIYGSRITDTNWHHIAMTKSLNEYKIYLDGKETASATDSNTVNATGNLNIGRIPTYTAAYFNGLIDEVRVSNVARTPEEIKAAAQRRPYAVYTAPVNDLTQTPGSWTGMTVQAKGVKTGDGETPHSTNSLVAAWNFNETSGTTATNNATAVSCGGTPSNCNGTLTNFASTASQDQAAGTGWTANNRRWGAGALMFDGSNDYVSVPDNASLDFERTNPFSVGMWVNFNSLSTQVIIAKAASGSTAPGWQFITESNVLKLHIEDVLGGVRVSTTNTITTGKWYYLVFTYDGGSAASGANIYIDGSSAGKVIDVNTLTGTILNNEPLTIGSRSGAAPFKGTIDSTRIYSRALTAAEILANYQAGNIEFQTRTSADNATWEAWKPVTNETAIDSMDSSLGSWDWDKKIPVGGMKLWFKADSITGLNDGDSVTTWNDSSGNSYNATQSTASLKPTYKTNIINGKPVVRFDGTDDKMTANGVISFFSGSDKPLSAFIVYKKSTATSSNADFVMMGDGGPPFHRIFTPHGNVQYNFQRRGDDGGLVSTSGGTGNANWNIDTQIFTGTAVSMYQNGTITLNNFAADVNTLTLNTFAIGSHTPAGSPPNGDIAEIIVYASQLSDSDRRSVEQYLGDKYAISPYTSDKSNDSTIKVEGTGSLKATIGAPQVDANTVGLWHMEETSGTGAYIKDATANANHGTPTGTTVVDGFFGKARSFNGTSDYVDIANPSNFNTVFNGGNPYTVSWWQKTSSSPFVAVISKRQVGTSQILPAYWPDANLGFSINSADGGGPPPQLSGSWSNTITLNEWDHYSITYDGSYTCAGVKGYKNGVLLGAKANCTQTLASPVTNTGPVHIGDSNGQYFFNGQLDEIVISNTARSAEEIAEAYRAGAQHRISRSLSTVNLSQVTKLPFYIAADRPGTYLEATIGESAYANYEPDANTKLLVHADEIPNTAGTSIKDSSGRGHTITANGNAQIKQTGKIGNSILFDGSGDYVSIPDSNDWNFGTGDFTIDFWLRFNVVVAGFEEQWLLNQRDPTNGYPKWAIFWNEVTSKLQFLVTDNVGTNILNMNPSWSPSANVWYHIAASRVSNNFDLYVNGASIANTTQSITMPDVSNPLEFGRQTASSAQLNGYLDEARISNTARTADEIRQAYEVGRRTHPVTIDFVSSPQAAYSSGTSVTINNPWGTSALTNTLSVGDTMIFKENVGGTETVSQATVNAVANTTSTYGTVTLAAAPTFPTGGYTTNATVFKWQREYFDITGSLGAQRDAVTRLTLRVTNGHEGRTVWLDDFKSASYINRGTCDTLNITTGVCTHLIPSSSVTSTLNRYFQTRMIFSSWDPAVSATLTSSQIEYGL